MDGIVEGSGPTGSTPVNMQALGLGGYVRAGDNLANCSIAEVLLYDHALTNEQISDVTDYLATKYVPEPATMIFLGLGGLAVLKRRK
jgi:hypothetical protein